MTITIDGDGTITGLSAGGLPNNSVQTADIADDQVTLAKLAGGTDGQIITYDASGNPVAVGPGTDGQVLTSTGAGSPPAFEAIPGGGITHATQFRISANWNPADSWTDITANWEVNDTTGYGTLGAAVTQSSGIFTFPVTGYWWVFFGAMADYNGSAVAYASCELQVTANASAGSPTWTALTLASSGIANASGNTYGMVHGDGIVDCTATADVKVKFRTETTEDTTWHGSTNNNQSWATFIRLADT